MQFDASTSSDPENELLTYRWDFGDGTSSTSVDPVHTYTVAGTYTARLTVDDGRGRNPATTVLIGVDNTPPRLLVAEPTDGATFRVGGPVRLRATWEDDEETAFPGARVRWEVALHHRDHTHPRGNLGGGDVTFAALSDHDADSHYVITATVTDPGGLQDSETFRIYPRTTPLRVVSEPPGAALAYADATTAGFPPIPSSAAPGFRTTISAQPAFVFDGLRVRFRDWSDGGAATHSVEIPDEGADYNDLLDDVHDVLASGDCLRVDVTKASCPEHLPLRLEAGDGDDTVAVLSDLGVTVDAGPGADRIQGGAGRDAFLAGDGDDAVTSRDGQPETVDCGAGTDSVVADLQDVVLGCEAVDVPFLGQSRAPAKLPPSAPSADTAAPRLSTPKRTATVRLDRRGRIRVRVGRLDEPARLRLDVRVTLTDSAQNTARRTLRVRVRR